MEAQAQKAGWSWMVEIYQAVAGTFVRIINQIWESEDSMKGYFLACYPGLPFTRTDFWNTLVHKIFRDAWHQSGPAIKAEPTGYDKMMVMRIAVAELDYNIFSQVLLNMQNYLGIGYDIAAAQKDLDAAKETWPKTAKLDPFKPGATMVKKASAQEEIAYNTILSMQKCIKIVSEFSGSTSFRVSPKGSTPAFADSKNVSMIGAGGDNYLRTLPHLGAYYLTWVLAPQMATESGVSSSEDGSKSKAFTAPGISYQFFSKSGGEILQEVLFARYLMQRIFKVVDISQKQCIQIPRMNSLLVVTQKPCPELNREVAVLQTQYPISFWEGTRDLSPRS
jgi:hypothetical protein